MVLGPTIVLSVLLSALAATAQLPVETPYGTLLGFEHEMSDGQIANIFLGVPYASAPIGDLKLEKPVPPEPWTQRNASVWPKMCAPHDGEIAKYTGGAESNSEDCLYLNIFAPGTKSAEPGGYPVAFYIHGGGFCFGDTEGYGYHTLCDNFVSRGIIVVTIQYRLGPFGFFSAGDSVIPGNYGLWDQRQALLFVREVIPAFGGDPNRITAWGGSAGGTSVSLLSASPHTRDLFAQAHQISGGAFAEWGNSARVIGVSRQLAKFLGCPDTTDSHKMKECFKGKSTAEIHAASDRLGVSRDDFNFDWYHPVAEVEWLGKDYLKELSDSPPKPTMIGVTSAESLLITAYIPDSLANMFSVHMGYDKAGIEKFNKNTLTEFIRKRIATKELFGKDAGEVFNDLNAHFVDRGTDEERKEKKLYFHRYTELLSDIQFFLPAIGDGLEKTKRGWPVYVWLLDYTNPFLEEEFGFTGGANHALELGYLQGRKVFAEYNDTETDRKLQAAFVEGVANFFKTGNPSSKTTTWPKMEEKNDFSYIRLREKATAENTFFKEKLDFWDKFNSKYSFDLVRGVNRDSRKPRDEL